MQLSAAIIPFGTKGDGQSLGAAPCPGQNRPRGHGEQIFTPFIVVFK